MTVEKLRPDSIVESVTTSPDLNEFNNEEQYLIPPSQRHHRLMFNRADGWYIWEVLGVIGCAFALGGLAVLLTSLDGHPLPDWSTWICVNYRGRRCQGIRVSLNSVVSLLSTIAKLCVMIPITKGIGQLKWVWFADRQRSLFDFEVFDSATRGLLGSAALIWRLRGRHLAALGAAAVIFSLGFDPFIQNVVTYGADWDEVKGDVALLSRALSFGYTGQYLDEPDPNEFIDFSLDLAINAYINPNLNSLHGRSGQTAPFASCNTCHCIWSNYTTLGVSAECKRISQDKISRTCSEPNLDTNGVKRLRCDYSLPNGPQLTGGLRTTVMSINTTDTPVVFTNLKVPPITTLQLLAALNTSVLTNSTNITALECVFNPVVWQYSHPDSGGNGNGPASNNVPASSPGRMVQMDMGPFLKHQNYVYEPGSGVSIVAPEYHPDNGSFMYQYNMSELAMRAIHNSIGKNYEGYVYLTQNTTNYKFKGAQNALRMLYQQQSLISSLAMESTSVVEDWISGVQYAITKSIAERGMFELLASMPDNRDPLQYERDMDAAMRSTCQAGKTFTPRTFVKVTWFWMALPIGVWLVSLIMLVGTMLKTRRSKVKVWRSNAIPLLFVDIDQDRRASVSGHGLSEDGLQKQAEALKLRLHLDERHARLSG